MFIKISDLRDLEIININDGRRLGPIKDIELDLERGAIQAIVLPNYTPGKIVGIFGRNDDLIVPWEKIRQIGIDVVLIDLPGQQADYAK